MVGVAVLLLVVFCIFTSYGSLMRLFIVDMSVYQRCFVIVVCHVRGSIFPENSSLLFWTVFSHLLTFQRLELYEPNIDVDKSSERTSRTHCQIF